jgi:hypothetical protein
MTGGLTEGMVAAGGALAHALVKTRRLKAKGLRLKP